MPANASDTAHHTNTDTNDDMSSENFSDAENDMSSASNASKKKGIYFYDKETCLILLFRN